MKKVVLTMIISLIALNLYSQEFDVPKFYKFEKIEDYATYEQDIILCVNWMLACPVNEHDMKRREASKFFMQWIAGSPSVRIDINSNIVTFMSTTPGMLIIFISGWTKYALETKDLNNALAGNMAGVEAVIDYYENNRKFLARDKNIEKYIKLKEKDELKGFIEKHI